VLEVVIKAKIKQKIEMVKENENEWIIF